MTVTKPAAVVEKVHVHHTSCRSSSNEELRAKDDTTAAAAAAYGS